MSLFSRQDSQSQPAKNRKARRPQGVSRRRKRELGFETLEVRQVMSAESPLVQLQGQVANSVSYNVQSYSSSTAEGQAAILQNELVWAALMSSGALNGEAAAKAIPTDPLLNLQWHLINSGQEVGNPDSQDIFAVPGEDINVGPVWNEGIFGNGVVVGIFEPGAFQAAHPDLAANVDPTLGFIAFGGVDAHATAVAGLIGAVANNGVGGSGVAPGVTLVPMSGANFADATSALRSINEAAFRFAIENGIDIINNSWGPQDNGELAPLTVAELQALSDSVVFGRDGLGIINVWAAGNGAAASFNDGFTDYGVWDYAGYDGFVNSRYTIGVTIVDHDGFYNNVDGTFTSYGEISTAVLVAAPSGSVFYNIGDDVNIGSGIVTTDLIGNTGFNVDGFLNDRDFLANTDYTSRFNGTSASAPIVSGVIALMLEANPNLTWRDVQEILVRSSRQNAEFEIPSTVGQGATQNTWIINQTPVFHDPDIFDPAIDPTIQTLFPTLDPSLSFNGGNGNHYAPTPQVLTNGAGYTVSQGVSPFGENFGYAHGVVDAELAVQLAQQWHTKSQNLPNELTFTTAVTPPQGGFFNLPAAEKGSQASGFQLVPGGIGGTVGGGFIGYWNEYFADDPFDDFNGTQVRGGFLEFSVPDNNDMIVDNVELKLSIAGGGAEFMDHVRVLLVSPNGTHSELNQYWVEPNNPFTLQNLSLATVSGTKSTVGPDGNLVWTFTTNRSWGERSDDAIVFDPTTGEPSGDTQGWRLFIENYDSSNAFQIEGIELVWHGSPIEAETQRIQGVVGVDDNQDNDFNFSRVTLSNTDLFGDAEVRYGEVQNIIDTSHESMAANVTVVARRASDNVIVDRFVTGADGNYYFDLVPDDYILSIEDPLDRVALEDTLSPDNILQHYRTEWTITSDFFKVWEYSEVGGNLEAAVDANGIPLSFGGTTTEYHVKDINFLLDPGPPVAQTVTFSGTVIADINGDGIFNNSDVNVPSVTVYADVNRNGQLDPGEVSVQTNTNGQYNLVVNNSITTVMNVGVIAPPNWVFSDPTTGFEPLFVEPGSVFTGINFSLTPPAGTNPGNGSTQPGYLLGSVYEDLNTNGSRQAAELGVGGIQVYVDGNNNGTFEVGERTTTTNANGAFIFANMPVGTHRIRIVTANPLVPINPLPGGARVATLSGGGSVSGIEFGIGNTANQDFGDLPAAYGITTTAQNGARHGKSVYFLGTKWDAELDGQPSDDAQGDDAIMGDEDGIVVAPLVPGTTGTLTATASRHGGVLQGWVDFNGDFDFNDPGERILTNVSLSAGVNSNITFQIPASITSDTIYARFRYGEYGINSVTGPAQVGEVEDYILARDPNSLPAVIEHGPDFNEDGYVNGRDFLIWQRGAGIQSGATGAQGDANSDGAVDYNDLVIWRNYYGTAPGTFAALRGDDEPEAIASLTSESVDVANSLAVDFDSVADEAKEYPASSALVADTFEVSVVEVSARESTTVAGADQDAVIALAARLIPLFETNQIESESEEVLEIEDFDAAFDDSSDLVELGIALRDKTRDRLAATIYSRFEYEHSENASDDSEAFELAFADEADWLPL